MPIYDPPFLPPSPEQQAARWGLRRISRFFILCTLLSLLLVACFEGPIIVLISHALDVFGLLGSRTLLEFIEQFYQPIVYIICFLLPFFLFARLIGFPLRTIPREPLHPPVLFSILGISMGAALGGLLLSSCALVFFSMFGLMPPSLTIIYPKNPVALVLFFLNTALLPAIVEEFCFRGVLLHALRPFGEASAVVISSLFFALMHRNMAQFPYSFVLGLVMGYFVLQTRSIYTGVIIHLMNNLVAAGINYFAVQFLSNLQAGLLLLMQYLLYLLAFAAGLFYLNARRSVSWRLTPIDCPISQTETLQRFLLHPPMLVLLGVFTISILHNFT